MNAIEILKKDHKEMLDTFSLIEKSSARALKTREKLINKVYKMITLHSRCEEKLIYPLGLNLSSLEKKTREAFAEHKAVDLLLEDLFNVAFDDENWLAKCVVIKENVQHHIKEEEKTMFPALRKKLSTDELNKLGKEILTFKVENAAQKR